MYSNGASFMKKKQLFKQQQPGGKANVFRFFYEKWKKLPLFYFEGRKSLSLWRRILYFLKDFL